MATETATVLVAVLVLLGQIFAGVIQYLTLRKTEVIHRATNSMKDELVRVTRSDALQQGRSEGMIYERAEAKAAPHPPGEGKEKPPLP